VLTSFRTAQFFGRLSIGWRQRPPRHRLKLCLVYIIMGIYVEASCNLNEMCIPVSTVPRPSALRSTARGDLRFGRTQHKATTRQPGILCDRSGRQSTTGHSFGSKTCLRHICSLVPTSMTNCFQSTSSEHCTAPLQ